MSKTYAAILLLPLVLVAPQAQAKKPLSIDFTISGTEGFDGVDPGSLSLSKGQLTGSIAVIAPGGPFTCAVNAGSTLTHNRLSLTCTIGPDEIVTLSGRLKSGTGIGKGSFSETFFKETGTYTAAKGSRTQR